jgi:thioredoxin reductase
LGNDIVRACKPDPKRSIYLLGGMSWRVSLHTQQRRALDLVDAVAGGFPSGSDMAVVGGGVAGVMCAAALFAKGHQVTLFERADALMPLQKKNTTRFIHPNSVTWPYSTLPSSTDLPFLNWHAAYSNEIAEMIEQEFISGFVGEEHQGINVNLATNVMKIENCSGKFRVAFKDGDDERHDLFTAVFITTGFSSERKISGYDRFSYWEDTSPIPIGSKFEKSSVAIVGDGDGALVELIRCAWPNENVDQLYRFITDKFVASAEKQDFIKTEEEVARTLFPTDPSGAQEALSAVYLGEILSPQGKKFLRSRYNATVTMTLLSKFSQPFSPRASPIHKVLLGFLLSEKLLTRTELEATGVTFRDGRYFVQGKVASGSTEVGPFNRVLERIGPSRSYCPLANDTFNTSRLEAFSKDNAAEFDFSNSITTDRYGPAAQMSGPLSEVAPIEAARDRLELYYHSNYDRKVAEVAIGKVGQEVGFRVVIHEENLKWDGPNIYAGYGIEYDRAKGPPKVI